MSQNQDKKLPVRFDLNEPQHKQLVNNILFTFEEDQENYSLNQTNQNSVTVVQAQPQSQLYLQKVDIKIAYDQVQKQLSQPKTQNTPPSVLGKKNFVKTRVSSIKANSKFTNAYNSEKDFVLELKKRDSSNHSKDSLTDLSKSSDEESEESDEEIFENSEIMNLQRKQSQSTIDEVEEKEPQVDQDCQNYQKQVQAAVEQILRQIRNKQEQRTNKNKQHYSFELIDLSNLLFFYLFMIWSDDFENLKKLHEYCQTNITQEKIEKLFTYKLFNSFFETKINMKDKMKEIIELENCLDQVFKILVQSYFLLIKQNVFEASLHYQYLVEFNQLTSGLQYQQNQKFEFYISQELFIQVMLQQNENYVKIFRENTYYISFDINQENFEYIKQCQYQNQQNPHPVLNELVMIYFYTIEKLNPKLITVIVNQIEDNQVLWIIFIHFLKYHLNSFAEKVLNKITQKSEYEKEIINLCLINNNFYILFQFYQMTGNKIKGWIEDFENQQMMIKGLARCTGINFLSLLFFIRKIQLWSQKDLIHMMADTLHKRLDASHSDNNFLFTFINPIKTIVLIIEILITTIKKEFFHKHILEKTRKKYSSFAQKLITNALDEEQAFDIFLDWDLDGRKLLYIIYENSMDEFIASDKVQEVIDILWHGYSTTTTNFINFCSIGQNLTNPTLQIQAIMSQEQCIGYPFDTSYQSEDFFGRLSVWKNQIQFRNSINQFFIIIFMILFLAYFLESFSIFTEGFMPIKEDTNLIDATITKMQENMAKWILVNIFVGVNLPLNAVNNLNYLKKYEKNATFTPSQIFDIFFGILTIFYTLFIFTMHVLSYENSQLFMIYFLNILTVCCYIRFILCLTATRAFGIILQALGVIFIEVAKFFQPFLAIFILFTFVGFILFNPIENGQFQNFIESLYFLVEAMFGQFKFQDFQKQYPITGSVFMLVYMYSLNIILMNVLVAILAFNFEKTNRQARILHYQHIIYHIRQGNYIQKHGCLILIPILLQFLAIPYLIMKQIFNSNPQLIKKCDNFFIYLSYSPIFAVVIICTILFNLILLPFAYIQRLFTLSKLTFYKQVKFYTLLLWFLFGILLLLKRMFYDDMKELVAYMFCQQSQAERANQIQKKLRFDQNMKQIFQTICRIYMNGQIYCTISELFIQVKEDMLKQNKQQQQTTCVDEDQIIGVHLIKNKSISRQSLAFNSPNLERFQSQKRNSTPLHLYLLQKQNSKNSMQKIDSMNVKHTFQGISQIEEECEQLFEYFERFCFKDIARGDEKRDYVLNLKNVLKLHESYSIVNLNVVAHFQLYKTIKAQLE
ncbi:transmembrane protein, putative (macronuclear) [Tetrahymena thermophila SB210]|uniref:Transmembrane protein, putative n=1 Tax=Tetrahymena thermophila (strain SB210) TaxID=312017 RepID=W7XE05_TETTS|nr:transmembrane protein, putative [Tetrahymena thermophila SB210]EWS75857.1 transmembrane protein, putative [Tetrahymena thermophila SB210]|eukprot:XP_012651613.1 transmembrane protein, putative [Tetrahymena thermophila SB210]